MDIWEGGLIGRINEFAVSTLPPPHKALDPSFTPQRSFSFPQREIPVSQAELASTWTPVQVMHGCPSNTPAMFSPSLHGLRAQGQQRLNTRASNLKTKPLKSQKSLKKGTKRYFCKIDRCEMATNISHYGYMSARNLSVTSARW